jgi:energy-coupling factor transport system ATP-binding protein
VGIVFQNPDNQMVATIIEDDVAFGPENLGLKSDEIRKRVDWALASVGMSEHAKGTPFKLSGGQKQRIAIAGVLALKPQVMILDESTAMLDPLSRKEIMDVAMRHVREENMTLINITHFVDEAMEADKIIVLNDGKVYLQGGKEVLTKEKELANIGLEAPLAVRIKNKLNAVGYSLPDLLTDKELVDNLCR